MVSKPHIVLLPGAWHTPECYSIIRPKLESHGYTIYTRQLPSVGSDSPPEDLSQDIAAVRELVTQAIGSGNDVVVVPHSWSGIVAGSALEGYSKKAREAKGEKGGVIRCGYMCSFMAPEGVSLCDAVEYKFPDWWGPQGGFSITNPKHAPYALYNDLLEDERQKWYAKTTTHSYGSKTAKASAMSWKEIPTSYLLCEDDLAIPMPAQEAMTSMVKDMGGDIEVERIKCSHSPFLSQPDYTVDWIRRVAGEKPLKRGDMDVTLRR